MVYLCSRLSTENFKSDELVLCLCHEKSRMTFNFSDVLCVRCESLTFVLDLRYRGLSYSFSIQ